MTTQTDIKFIFSILFRLHLRGIYYWLCTFKSYIIIVQDLFSTLLFSSVLYFFLLCPFSSLCLRFFFAVINCLERMMQLQNYTILVWDSYCALTVWYVKKYKQFSSLFCNLTIIAVKLHDQIECSTYTNTNTYFYYYDSEFLYQCSEESECHLECRIVSLVV